MLKRLKQDIDTYMARDPAAHSRLEVFLCAPGLHAVMWYRVAHKIHRMGFKIIARVLSQFARFMTGVEIHPAARIGERFFIDHGMGVVIGETATIGDDVSIYHGVTLGGVSPISSQKGSIRHPQVGDGVIIGSGAQLLGPIEVGDYVRVGSNAVVVSDVESCSTVVGIPARPVRSKKKEEDHEFRAYAISGKVEDPMMAKMEALIREVEHLKKQVQNLEPMAEDLADMAESWETETRKK
jgi:serine O-acetyltransferase